MTPGAVEVLKAKVQRLINEAEDKINDDCYNRQIILEELIRDLRELTQ
jgi:hypothetical protein